MLPDILNQGPNSNSAIEALALKEYDYQIKNILKKYLQLLKTSMRESRQDL